jgi:RNA polymerase subunit RPABC4/transcription elongation factor Spt4
VYNASANLISSKLCKYCRGIIDRCPPTQGNDQVFERWSDILAIEQSAHNGCALCSQFLQSCDKEKTRTWWKTNIRFDFSVKAHLQHWGHDRDVGNVIRCDLSIHIPYGPYLSSVRFIDATDPGRFLSEWSVENLSA